MQIDSAVELGRGSVVLHRRNTSWLMASLGTPVDRD
jgi:hypothetical protein